MVPDIRLDSSSPEPLYRQLYEQFKTAIRHGGLARGEKLPPTRELAGSLGLNRTTVAAAYELLESDGLIRGHVGRGSFVQALPDRLETRDGVAALPVAARISFSASRPSEMLFPLEEFRATCREVLDSAEATQILQLGPAAGYAPLRRYLLDQARERGIAGPDDDILITSGCQQAFDLLQRVFASRGETVLLEDPVYPGLRNVFARGGARVTGVPLGENEMDELARAVEKERPRMIVLTPNFQNPTGTTMPEPARKMVLEVARKAGAIVVENDLYGDLRYRGRALPAMKHLDRTAGTIYLSSFSKIAFPGLRVGWAIGPRHFLAGLIEAKQASDLHSDQLSQAVLLRFAESGRLAAHRGRMRKTGGERLQACLEACERELPARSRFTRPEGGMNVWVQLPDWLDACELASRAEQEGVSFLPGRTFEVSRPQPHSLRLSFAGLEPKEIRAGLAVLGKIARSDSGRGVRREEPALV